MGRSGPAAGLLLTLALVGAALLGVAPAGAADPARDDPAGDERTRGQGAAWTPSATRPTTLGRVRGRQPSAGSYSWLGVPYAEPPTGRLRWRPPVTHRRWDGVRRTTAYGDGCTQPGRMFSPSPDGPHYDLQIRDGLGTPVGSEDCLTLNAFRPATAERDLPVIVFVHGGSNTVGYSADPLYDGRHLARRANAVVVTVNYRLGLFGWLNHEGLKTGRPVADSGNFGTLDLVESLRFVHRNARTFGGDPGNVTAMGESAGAVNVWSLLVSPLTKGLVHKAVPMSGGLSFAPEAQGRTYADQLATHAVEEEGSPSDADDPIRLMRSLSAEELQALALRHPELGANPPAVFPDGAVVPEDPYGAIAAGDYRRGPVLAGNTLEEGKLFGALVGAYAVDDRRRFTLMHRSRPTRPSGLETSDLIAEQYLPVDRPGGWDDAAEALTRGVFTQLTAQSMGQLDAAGHRKLFYYQFAWDSEPEPWDEVYGSVHAMDLPFVFGTFGRSLFSFAYGPANRPGRLGLSGLMGRSLERFVRTGDPGHGGLDDRWRQWPASTVFDATKRRGSGTAGTFVPPDAGPVG